MRQLTCVSSRSSFGLSIMRGYAHNWSAVLCLYLAALVMSTPISVRVSKWKVGHEYVTWVTDGGA
jgi:hypothetical protein